MTALIVAAYGLDLLTFALIVPLVGGDAEQNAIMRLAYADFGLVMVVILKALACLVILLLVARVHDPGRRRMAAGIGLGIALLGVAGNLSAVR